MVATVGAARSWLTVSSGTVGLAPHPAENAAAITARVTVERMATPPASDP
jgi:hypothetical protein